MIRVHMMSINELGDYEIMKLEHNKSIYVHKLIHKHAMSNK